MSPHLIHAIRTLIVVMSAGVAFTSLRMSIGYLRAARRFGQFEYLADAGFMLGQVVVACGIVAIQSLRRNAPIQWWGAAPFLAWGFVMLTSAVALERRTMQLRRAATPHRRKEDESIPPLRPSAVVAAIRRRR